MSSRRSDDATEQSSQAMDAFLTRWSGAGADDVPALDTLTEQLHALTLGKSAARQASTPPASAAPAVRSGGGHASGVRRGFFDSTPAKQQPWQQPPKRSCEEDVVRLVSLPAAAAAKGIPDALKLPPDNEVVRQAALVGALQPSQDMMATILGSPELLEAFDDPAVMAAVSEVAANPAAFAKHGHNPKVRAFYDRMSEVAAKQLARAGVTPYGRAQHTAAAETRAQPHSRPRARITELN